MWIGKKHELYGFCIIILKFLLFLLLNNWECHPSSWVSWFLYWLVFTDTTLSGEIGTKKKVKRLLSFQRYFHASRLLRGIVPQASLYLLDEDYLGQARVRRVSRSPFPLLIFQRVSVLFQSSDKPMYGWSFLNDPRYLPASQQTDCPFLFYGYSFKGLVSNQRENV